MGRWFEHGVRLRPAQRVDLLADRHLYEPGESVHVWALARNVTTGAPLPQAAFALTITDPRGRALLERQVVADVSGSVSVDLPLPSSAGHGEYQVVARVTLPQGDAFSGSRGFVVGRRTVERLLAELTLDQRVVRPRQRVTGRVAVHTPSGAPVVGASVAIEQALGQGTQAVTDDAGVAEFALSAPSYLLGDMGTTEVTVRISHPGHGALHLGGSYVLARTRFQVEVHAASGGVVPGVPTFAYLRVSDALGEPAPEGSTVEVSGPAVPGGRHRALTDAHGLVQVPVALDLADVAPVRTSGLRCPSGPATLLDVSIEASAEGEAQGSPARAQRAAPVQTRACLSVARDATVVPRVASAVVDQGGEVEVELARRATARDATILVELLSDDGAAVLASAWAQRGDARVTLRLPPHALGVLRVRARPVAPANARAALDADGAVGVGVGAHDALLVRHADAFALSLARDREVYDVGTRAELALEANPAAPGRAWATLVARDLAAHGGEPNYALPVLEDALRSSVVDRSAGNELLVRATLAAALERDSAPNEPPPLAPAPWDRRGRTFRGNTERGVLRDPLAAREELRRRELGRVMVMLEHRVDALPADGSARDDVVSGSGARQDFRADVLAHLHQQRNGADYRTLGGETMTVRMLSEVDRSFTFDAVARRVARAKLVRLMAAIAAFTNPDDETAARASSGLPPEQWLSRLVQMGAVPPAALLDPWGRPFVFRHAGSRRPPVMLSDRAPGWELISAGPDGRAGNGDDVLDPFARVVPRGTVYAVASGEDTLMRALALLAPGPDTLARMHVAYTTMSQAARDERAPAAMVATTTEASPDAAVAGPQDRGQLDFDDSDLVTGDLVRPDGELLNVRRQAQAASGEAVDALFELEEERARSREATRAPAPPPPPMVGGSSLATLSERIREDFPATLFFVGRVALDGARTPVTIPLADALTTYRVEAIAWTGSGFVDVARTTLRVVQSATVDTPVPNAAVVGDVVRFPVRVANRTAEPLDVLVDVTSEGVEVVPPQAVALRVPPRDAAETTLEMRLPVAGEGHLVVRAVRADTRAPLDAVRRPLAVRADARLVHFSQQVLVVPGEALHVEVPADASERGPGELRVASGVAMFGAYDIPDLTERGWARRMAALEVPSDEREHARDALQASRPDEARHIGGDPARLARAVSILWNDAGTSDMVLGRGLRAITRVIEGESADPGRVEARCAALLGLAPAAQGSGRSALQEDLRALVGDLRAEVGDGAARLDDRHGATALTCAAASLALTRGSAADERAAELLRRAGAFMVAMGEGILVEDPTRDGTLARTLPTAYAALAMIGQDRAAAALRFLRAQADVAEAVRGGHAQAPSVAALAMLARGVPDRLGVTLDGRAVDVRSTDGVHVASLEGLGRPGRHSVRVDTPVLALVYLDVRYGRPWTAAPERPMPVDIELTGEVGARDTRAGLALTLRNRMPRTLARGVAEIDLPAGVELDQPTREALAGRVRSVSQTGRTLVLELRALPAGGFVTLPLPIRHSISGSLRGLGVSLYDATVRGGSLRPAAVLPSRALVVPDDGPEPDAADAAQGAPPTPVPTPTPMPGPIDVLRPVAAVGAHEAAPRRTFGVHSGG
ncbi:MAG: MG2 domain-containing protein [Polyangiales bacterium]